jgi:hypothetical protein
MHTASDVFVILKAGPPTRIARRQRALPLIIDAWPGKQAGNTGLRGKVAEFLTGGQAKFQAGSDQPESEKRPVVNEHGGIVPMPGPAVTRIFCHLARRRSNVEIACTPTNSSRLNRIWRNNHAYDERLRLLVVTPVSSSGVGSRRWGR